MQTYRKIHRTKKSVKFIQIKQKRKNWVHKRIFIAQRKSEQNSVRPERHANNIITFHHSYIIYAPYSNSWCLRFIQSWVEYSGNRKRMIIVVPRRGITSNEKRRIQKHRYYLMQIANIVAKSLNVERNSIKRNN